MRNLALFWAFWCLAASAGGQVEVTYVANEGFLVSGGGRSVVVDALFPGLEHYRSATPETQGALERGTGAFDGVGLALATHYHADHFGAAEVSRFLAGHPQAHFVSTPQAVSELRALSKDDVSDRVHAELPEEGIKKRIEAGGVRVTVVNLHHGRSRPEIQNLGYLLELGGVRLLHIGDTEISVQEIAELDLAAEKIDIAMVPLWYLTESSWGGVIEAIQPRYVIGMHLAEPDAPRSWFGRAGSQEGRLAIARERFPDAWIPVEELAMRLYPPQ